MLKNYRKNPWINGINSILILISIGILIVAERFGSSYQEHRHTYETLETLLLAFFAFDYVARLFSAGGGKAYVLSWPGVIDLVTIVTGGLALVFGNVAGLGWLRALRIIRLTRAVSSLGSENIYYGIFAQISPYVVLVLALKGVAFSFEDRSWWPSLEGINTILGVVGFAVAVALGAKLSIVIGRIYALEDAICRIIGCVRDMEHRASVRSDLIRWCQSLEDALCASKDERPEQAKLMRRKTDEVAQVLVAEGLGGPSTVSFHRDAAFLLHRMTASTPPSFDRFLMVMTIIYALTLIATVPGMTGLFCSVLVSLGLGGLFLLVRDMDDPLMFDRKSLIDIRMDALVQFNAARKKPVNHD